MSQNVPWYLISERVETSNASKGELGETAMAEVLFPFCERHDLGYLRNVPTRKTDGDKDSVITSEDGKSAVIEVKNWLTDFYFSINWAKRIIKKFGEDDPTNRNLRVLVIPKLKTSQKVRDLLRANSIHTIETRKQILTEHDDSNRSWEQRNKKCLFPLLTSFFDLERKRKRKDNSGCKVFLTMYSYQGILHQNSVISVSFSKPSPIMYSEISLVSMLNHVHPSENLSTVCLSTYRFFRSVK